MTLGAAIRLQEGKVTDAKGHLKSYEAERGAMEAEFEKENERYRQIKVTIRKWRAELEMSNRVLTTLREAAGMPFEPAQTGAAPVPPLPQPKEVPVVKPESPFPQAVNGFDIASRRKGWRQQLALWNVNRYPMPMSYSARSVLFNQALRTKVAESRDYDKWLAAGHLRVTDSSVSGDRSYLVGAATALGVDHHEVRDIVYAFHADIAAYGEFGVDRMWGPA
jgi:hypothetical protein